MAVQPLQPGALYPVADRGHLPKGWRAHRTRARWTGERRAPRQGDWYLSGAIIEAYQAPNDLNNTYPIATLVRVTTRTVTTED